MSAESMTKVPADPQRAKADAPVGAPATRRFVVQRSLRVGASDDRHEVEADAVAADVVQHLRRASVHRTSTDDASTDDASTPGASTPGASTPDASTQVVDTPSDGRIRRSTMSATVTPVESASRIQRMSAPDQLSTAPVVGSEGGSVDGEIESRIKARSGGQAMDDGVRRSMEGAFGADFTGVRVHTDSAVAGSIGATAFTHGSDVHFAPGAYEPTSASGQHLLAHELTHTLQQGGAHRTMRSAAVVQRDHTDTGLKKEGAIKGFASKVKARATGGKNPLGSVKEWDTLSVDARVAKLTKYVNAELVKTHVPPVTYTLDPGKAAGNAEFNFQTWSLTIGSGGMDAAMSDDLIGTVADNVYHESRHAEQWFRVARTKAGESPEPDAATLASTLWIPAAVASAAHDRPLKPLTKTQKFFRTKKYNERQDVKLAEAKSWYESVYGAGGAARNEVLGDIQVRYGEYRALSEEVDAWDVGGKAGAKVRALMAELRVKEAAAAAAKLPKVPVSV